jgi:hypothetical protein
LRRADHSSKESYQPSVSVRLRNLTKEEAKARNGLERHVRRRRWAEWSVAFLEKFHCICKTTYRLTELKLNEKLCVALDVAVTHYRRMILTRDGNLQVELLRTVNNRPILRDMSTF